MDRAQTSNEVHFEGELALVVGRPAKDVPKEKALEILLGYSAANDVTARDQQRTDGQWARAKGYDSFCPVGPWIETVLDPADLALTTRVNGEVKQSARTSLLIHDIPLLVATFLPQLNKEHGRNVWDVTPEAMDALQNYPWPGNVRELRNVLEGVVVLSRKEVIGLGDTPRPREKAAPTGEVTYSTGCILRMLRKDGQVASDKSASVNVINPAAIYEMGVVYQAEHRHLERMVAIKVMHPRLVANPVAVERFRHEVKAAARLNHSNIVATFDADQAGDADPTELLPQALVAGEQLRGNGGRNRAPRVGDARQLLQFRRGRLTGWRRDWQMRPHWW